jgi:hypothetical protein
MIMVQQQSPFLLLIKANNYLSNKFIFRKKLLLFIYQNNISR